MTSHTTSSRPATQTSIPWDKDRGLRRYQAALKKHGSQRAVAKAWNIPRSTLQDWLRAPVAYTKKAPKPPLIIATPKRDVRRFIFTSAQDATEVHTKFLDNLEAYAKHMDASIHIGGFTYAKRLFQENRKDSDKQWFHPRIERYLDNRQMQIGPGLIWAAEMNTLPTATQPLSGFEVYTREKWGIFPHAKVQLVSIPTMKGTPAKQIMTTGAVTMPNYVQRRAGILAHFHHVIGAVLVEIDSSGDHFCRHLIAEFDTGNFQDLTRYVHDGVVEDNCRVEAINWGDIHLEKMDWNVARHAWGIGRIGDILHDRIAQMDSMIDVLRPSYQMFHDVTDFTARNHHNIRDPHFKYAQWYAGSESVEDSFIEVGSFLSKTYRDWCKTVVVESNHDLAALRWLKETDWRDDPVNAEFHLQAQLALLKSIRERDGFSVLGWALRRSHPVLMKNVAFLSEDESFTICDGEIEVGMHGHLGANGAKGSPRQFTKMGPKANTGHCHSANIIDGIYTAGVSGSLEMGYNQGLSSWSNAHVITYPNGKRAIVTMQSGKWHA